MTRDNFSPATKSLLALSVGLNCVRPGCAKPTHALSLDGTRMATLGVAAHDSAASPGGPGYNADLTPFQRSAFENGAWLCANCSRIVDGDRGRYPDGTITIWQRQAVEARRHRSQTPWLPLNFRHDVACERAATFLKLLDGLSFGPWATVPQRSLLLADRALQHRFSVQNPTDGLSSQYPHTIGVQIRILDALDAIRTDARSFGVWWFDNEQQVYRLADKYSYCSTEQERQFNRSIDESSDRFWSRVRDFNESQGELRAFSNGQLSSADLFGW